MGRGTRSQIKEMARKGRISVNGQVARQADLKILPEEDLVSLDGTPVAYARMEYYMLNKPRGVVSATEDGRYRTVTELITGALRNDLFPVGRLDIDTEGLLLITNDGALAHNLLSPKKHVDKVYYAKVQGKVDESDVKAFADGVDIGDDTPAKSADLRILKSGEESEIELTITEGRFHQVKRMFHAVGKEVIYLKRLSMGSLALDKTLTKGEYRSLTEEEIKKLC